MRLRSAIPGRQRWDVPAIYRQPDRARRAEAWLVGQPGVLEARADASTGRVLVLYEPDGGARDIAALIREAIVHADRLVDEPGPDAGALKRMLSLAVPEPGRLAGPAALSIVGQGVHLAQGLAFMGTINAARKAATTGVLRAAAGGLFSPTLGLALALTGVDLVIQQRRRLAWRRAAAEARGRLRSAVLTRIEAQDAAFFDRYGAARLASVVTQDTQTITDLIEHAGDQAISKVVTIGVAGAAVAAVSPRLALIGALPLPLLFIPGQLLKAKVRDRYRIASEDTDRFSRQLADNFAGIADIKGYTAETAELRRLAEADDRQASSAIDAATTSSLQTVLVEGIFTTGYALTATYAGQLASGGKLSAEALGRLLYFYPQVAGAVMTVGELTRRRHLAVQAAERLAEVMDTPPGISGGRRRAPRQEVKGEIVFEDVWFRHATGRGGLQHVSFKVGAGETVAVVGPTGSGKSTLLKLLPRHYDVDSGRILLDGRDIRKLRLSDLRHAIALVRQDAFLFDGDVRDNVRLGRPRAGDTLIEAALKAAQVEDLVASLPGGLAAELGEGGRRLSGGERQRLALARAFLRDAPVLLLDEVTSHLDYATETAVKRALRRAARGRTVIVVAHRLSTIRDSDRIVVLDRGRLREQGTHDELLAQDGLYASLWRLQSEEERALDVQADAPAQTEEAAS